MLGYVIFERLPHALTIIIINPKLADDPYMCYSTSIAARATTQFLSTRFLLNSSLFLSPWPPPQSLIPLQHTFRSASCIQPEHSPGTPSLPPYELSNPHQLNLDTVCAAPDARGGDPLILIVDSCIEIDRRDGSPHRPSHLSVQPAKAGQAW